jgi:hypothetical protein
MLWNSTFVAIISLLEEEIVELALEQHAKRNGDDSPVHAFRKRFWGMDEAVDEMKKDVPHIKGARDWQEIAHYREIRNIIVHGRSRLCFLTPEEKLLLTAETDAKKREAIERDAAQSVLIVEYARRRDLEGKSGLVVADGFVKVYPTYCREALGTIYGFLRRVISSLPL